MKKFIFTVILIALAIIPAAADDTPYISVTGKAEVSMQPDTASFQISATAVEDTTDEARIKTSEMVSMAVGILTSEFGVTDENLTTSYLAASPEYEWRDDEKILVGQRATQTINVKVTDLDSIGNIYENLMKIDGITISDVTLGVNAMKDAYSKAEAYLEAVNAKVGKLISVSDSSSYATPLYRSANLMLASADTSAKAVSTEYYTDDISVSTSVSVVFEIIQ